VPTTVDDSDHGDTVLKNDEVDHVGEAAKPSLSNILERNWELQRRLLDCSESDSHSAKELVAKPNAALVRSESGAD
jgi:hypothetical protein